MAHPRIPEALALAGGVPAGGRILIVGPHGDDGLAGLPRAVCHVVSASRTEHDRLAAQGWSIDLAPAGAYAAAVVVLPRARAQFRAFVHLAAAALPHGAALVVDGQKTDGMEAAARELAARATVVAVVARAHGRAVAIANPGADAFADWQDGPHVLPDGMVTRPGVFSADGPDPGSVLLAANLPADLRGAGADLGAGWGWLAARVLARPAVSSLDLVEADAVALDCARLNVTDGRARFHWADATRFRAPAPLDFVVMNPPFHRGRAADPAVGAAFIDAAARLLGPGGRLLMVANRTLPYEDRLAAAFGVVTRLAADGAFKVIAASRPRARGR